MASARNRRLMLWGGLGAMGLAAAMGAAWMLALPTAPTTKQAPPIGREEGEAILSSLKPRSARRPVVAIVGINDGTETTDYLLPYGVLRRAGVADVVLLATEPGPVELHPALTVQPEATIASFDAQHPEGADYVIVPAMMRDDDPVVLAWLKQQSARGAIVVGVCSGARVVGKAGLLDGKRATTHWYDREALLVRHPAIHYVPDRRLVADRGVMTTTGVTASMPMTLTLIEAMAGRDRAAEVARSVGVPQWDARHDSGAFCLTRPLAMTAITNTAAFWNHEQLGIELLPGVDEASLALVADAWSRTYRSRALTFAATPGDRESRNGVRMLPDRVTAAWPKEHRLPSIGDVPARALDDALQGIAARYGTRTSNFVAVQLEYPTPGPGVRSP